MFPNHLKSYLCRHITFLLIPLHPNSSSTFLAIRILDKVRRIARMGSVNSASRFPLKCRFNFDASTISVTFLIGCSPSRSWSEIRRTLLRNYWYRNIGKIWNREIEKIHCSWKEGGKRGNGKFAIIWIAKNTLGILLDFCYSLNWLIVDVLRLKKKMLFIVIRIWPRMK